MQDREEVVLVRRRVPWRVVVPIVVLAVGLASFFSVRADRRSRRRHTDAIRQVLAIVDHDFQTCALGEPAPDGELGKRAAIAGLTGRLTHSKAQACGELAQQALNEHRSLRDENRDLDPFWNYDFSFGDAPGFGVCRHVEAARGEARRLGFDVPTPDCEIHFERLVATVDGGSEQVRTIVDGDELILELDRSRSDGEARVVRRTRDGKSWDETPPLRTTVPLQITRNGVFGFGWVKDEVRYHVLDGDRWHAGTRPADGGLPVAARRTAAGWTLVDRWDDSPSVVRLDAEMDHLLETVSIPALRGRWIWDAHAFATIEEDGSVVAFLVAAAGKQVVFEAHRVPVGAKPQPPIVLTFDHDAKDLDVEDCHRGSVTFVAIPGVAALVTNDGGKTFKRLQGGDEVNASSFDCTPQHFYAGDARQFSSCDLERCVTVPLPVAAGASVRFDVSTHGDAARVLAAMHGNAVLYDFDANAAKLSPVKVWAWSDDYVARPGYLIDGTWFTLPLDRPAGF